MSDEVLGNEALVDEIDVARKMASGKQKFMGLELLCGQGALVPRPETELLANTAIGIVRESDSARVVDMCCGAGNLACAIVSHVPQARVWASDLTDGCVGWSRKNVAHLGLGDRIEVAQGDLFVGFTGKGLEVTIDLVVCNPPYISTGRLEAERAPLLDHEPREAFDGGPYGLSIHQRVIKEAVAFLKPRGWLLFEFGLGQERQLRILFDRAKAYENFQLKNNEAGVPRVALAQVKG